MRQLLVGILIGLIVGCALGLAISNSQSVLTSKLLEWPFLLFLSASIIVSLFYQPIRELLGRGDIRIKWGEDKEIQLKDLSRNFDKEIDPIAADVDQLKKDLEEVRARVQSTGGTAPTGKAAPASAVSEPNLSVAWRIMENAILASQYKWRRVSTLADLASVAEDAALAILRTRDEVMLGRNKEGLPIATLKSKINRDAAGD
jgi:hypothetical protein